MRRVLALLVLLSPLGLPVGLPVPAAAHVHDHPEWDKWFADQVTPDDRRYSCCNKSDAYLLRDDEVRIVDGEYEVLTAQGWLRFPNKGEGNPGNTVMGYSRNPTGQAVAWYIGGGPGEHHDASLPTPFCFAPGTET